MLGTAATAPTKVFINVSTGPWLDFPAGTTNLPVHSAAGFAVGEKISIDLGGDTEIATVTSVGKAATQTTLAVSTTPGATNIKLTALADVSAGDTLTISTGQRMERAVVASVGTAGPQGTGVTLTAPLKLPHTSGVDVWGRGTGISFTPATRFAHRSGDAVQALGSGVVLDRPLARAHAYGAPVQYRGVTNEGYQGPAPQAWFGSTLFITGGAIALTDASGAVVMDAIVYGSQQSNSSASGYITRPDLATLEGVQHQGGCMAIVPGAGSGPATANIAAAAAAPGAPNRSIGRFPDGHDADSLCTDFVVQPVTTLPEGAAAGATNIKVAGVAGFASGQTVMIGSGPASETAVIACRRHGGQHPRERGDAGGRHRHSRRGHRRLRRGPIDHHRQRRQPGNRHHRPGTGRPRRRPYHRDGAAQDCPSVRHAAGGERHHAHGAARPRAYPWRGRDDGPADARRGEQVLQPRAAR